VSERHACAVVGCALSSQRYRALRPLQEALRERLRALAHERSYPARIQVDNGAEFRSRALDAWAYDHRVTLDFIEPGKPIRNAVIESFNGRMRDELLNQHWWTTLGEVRDALVAYRADYNELRPHSALGNRAPADFARAGAANIQPQRLAS
jgi:putative transposase